MKTQSTDWLALLLVGVAVSGCNAILGNEDPFLRDDHDAGSNDARFSDDKTTLLDSPRDGTLGDVSVDLAVPDTNVAPDTGGPDTVTDVGNGDGASGRDAGADGDAAQGDVGQPSGDASDGGIRPDVTLDTPSFPDVDGGVRDADVRADEGGLSLPDVVSDVFDAGCTDPVACTPETPRPTAPLSTGRVTSRQPTVRWKGAPKAQRYFVDFCADQACTSIRETVQTTNLTAKPTTPLPASKPTFWRVRAENGAFSTPSVTWVFNVGVGSAAVDASWLGPPDFNGDGLPDVGLSSASMQVFVMMNHAVNRLPTVPSQTLTGTGSFGVATANAGDVDGDGKSDFLVGTSTTGIASVFLGTSTGVDPSPKTFGPGTTYFGTTVAGVGDLNGDGYADVAIGDNASNRKTNIHLGGPTGPSATAWTTGLVGSPVGGAGDVNGDGYSDVVTCTPDGNIAMVYLFNSAGVALDQMITAPTGETAFGESCITAGDVNGDGYADVVVTTAGLHNAFVYYGSASGIQLTGFTKLPGASGGGYSGTVTSIAPAGDVNGDGYDDVIVGAYNDNSIYVYHGGASGISTVASTSFETLPAGAIFGHSVATVGDANGDGYADIAFAGGACTGTDVYVYPGSASGVTTSAPMRNWANPSGVQCLGIIAR